jgi:hypothetical protein
MVALEKVHEADVQSLDGLYEDLVREGISRAYIVQQDGKFQLSHPTVLEPVLAFLKESPDFAGHEAIFIGREKGLPALFVAVVHDTRRGLAQGGVRCRSYDSLEDAFTDSLRLSQGMTRKNALADLWWGGGKAVVAVVGGAKSAAYLVPGTKERRRLIRAFGRFIASLNGIYYTAEDIGTSTADMNALLAANRFVTCVGKRLGGSGNPSPHTARGVKNACRSAGRSVWNRKACAAYGSVRGRNVGSPDQAVGEGRSVIWSVTCAASLSEGSSPRRTSGSSSPTRL